MAAMWQFEIMGIIGIGAANFQVKARHGLPSQERELTAKRPFLQCSSPKDVSIWIKKPSNVSERDESGQLGERIWIRPHHAHLWSCRSRLPFKSRAKLPSISWKSLGSCNAVPDLHFANVLGCEKEPGEEPSKSDSCHRSFDNVWKVVCLYTMMQSHDNNQQCPFHHFIQFCDPDIRSCTWHWATRWLVCSLASKIQCKLVKKPHLQNVNWRSNKAETASELQTRVVASRGPVQICEDTSHGG